MQRRERAQLWRSLVWTRLSGEECGWAKRGRSVKEARRDAREGVGQRRDEL